MNNKIISSAMAVLAITFISLSWTDAAPEEVTEMAPYEVMERKAGFEIRKYPARKWAATMMTGGLERRKHTSAMFRKLFNYISGMNTQNITIEMTTPVTTYFQPGDCHSCENTWTEAFYVPQIHQENPPTGDEIFIEERPEMIVYTRRFGGYASDDIIAMEATELAELIMAANETGVDFNNYYVAGYDSPFKPINRRNEIWYIKTQ